VGIRIDKLVLQYLLKSRMDLDHQLARRSCPVASTQRHAQLVGQWHNGRGASDGPSTFSGHSEDELIWDSLLAGKSMILGNPKFKKTRSISHHKRPQNGRRRHRHHHHHQ
jgi:hypothetical protein